jgi:hypothetical membrane protein
MTTEQATTRSTSRIDQTDTGRLRAAAWAGLVGPALFTAAFLVQEAFRRDEYSPLAETVSALEAGPHGWVQQVSFVVFGLLTMAFAWGMHRGLAPTKSGIAGPAALFVTGIGLFVAAAVPIREDAAGVSILPGGHLAGGLLFFFGSPVALLLLSRRMRHDPAWRSLATYALVVALTMFAAAAVMITQVIPDDAPLHDKAGLAQRLIILALLFPCRMVMAGRLLGVARGRVTR